MQAEESIVNSHHPEYFILLPKRRQLTVSIKKSKIV